MQALKHCTLTSLSRVRTTFLNPLQIISQLISLIIQPIGINELNCSKFCKHQWMHIFEIHAFILLIRFSKFIPRCSPCILLESPLLVPLLKVRFCIPSHLEHGYVSHLLLSTKQWFLNLWHQYISPWKSNSDLCCQINIQPYQVFPPLRLCYIYASTKWIDGITKKNIHQVTVSDDHLWTTNITPNSLLR